MPYVKFQSKPFDFQLNNSFAPFSFYISISENFSSDPDLLGPSTAVFAVAVLLGLTIIVGGWFVFFCLYGNI